MKILFVCHEYPPKPHGGIGSFTKLLAEELVEKGVKVGVIGYGQTNSSSMSQENGVSVFRIANSKQSKNKYKGVLRAFTNRLGFHRALKKHISTFNPDIIETYEWSGPLLFKYKGIKLVVRLHGSNTANNDYMKLKRNPIISYFEKRTIGQADHVVAVSNHIRDITRTSFQSNFESQTIYNGVDCSHFRPQKLERDQNKLILVGRMHPHKGFEYLFASLNKLFQTNTGIHLDVICTVNVEYKNRLMAMVHPKFHDRIQFLGRIPNAELNRIYSSANLTVFPSLSEALGIIPLESMACETPVIMANRCGAKEIITNGVDGFLADIMDADHFANQISHILENQSQIESMREAARLKILAKFNNQQILDENLEFYRSILS